jgi:hypothetical protein
MQNIVNAHGSGIIVPQLLDNQTPLTVELANVVIMWQRHA